MSTRNKKKTQHFTWLYISSSDLKREILDECEVSSWQNPRKEIEAYIKKQYRNSMKIHRIIDEEKVLKCPTELIWDSYIRQEYQGRCTYCGYEFVKFLGKEKNKPENFKHCLGFGSSSIPGRDKLVTIFECPECFEKTYFHVDERWFYLFGEWIVDNSIHLKKSVA